MKKKNAITLKLSNQFAGFIMPVLTDQLGHLLLTETRLYCFILSCPYVRVIRKELLAEGGVPNVRLMQL